jgi:NHLM bacteriocin system ABC transporter ATP-binding protein
MSEVANVFTSEGTLLEVGSNQPFWLTERESAWFIAAGKVEVFSVPVENGEPIGSRAHFVRAEAGWVLFGLAAPGAESPLTFVAVGSTDARVYKLPLARLKDLTRTSGGRLQLGQWIERWVSALFAGASRDLPPKDFETLQPATEISLGPAQSARPAEGVVWVTQVAGRSQLAGHAELAVAPDTVALPLTPAAWLEATEESTLHCSDTASVIERDGLWAGLERFYPLVHRWTALNLARAAAEEAARLQAKARSQGLAAQSAVSQLSSLLVPERARRAAGPREEDPLLAACQLIGQALGVAVKAHPALKRGRVLKDPLGAIAKVSRIRIRRVVLSGEWWEQDSGPLLAFRQADSRPVALLPTSATSCDVADPVAGTRERVTREIAQALQPTAYTFYRPFPDKALAVVDVFKFGLQNLQRDLLMVLLMGLAGGALGALTPIATGLLFDWVIPNQDRRNLGFLTLGLAVAALAGAIFQITRGIALMRIETKSDASIQGAVWDRLLSLPAPFFRSYTSGDLADRANGISSIREILSGAVLTSVLSGVFSVFNFLLLFYYSGSLALVATGLIVLNIAVTAGVSLYTLRLHRPLHALQGKISGQVLQFITGITKLRVAAAEVHAFAVWARNFSEQKRLDLATGRVYNGVAVFNEVYPILTTICLFAAMAYWARGDMTTGKFLAFNAAFTTFLYATLDVSAALISMLHVVPVYERAKPILATLPEVTEAKADPGELQGRIELSHVSFRYKADGPPILRDLSLQISPGQFVAIVGPSGSGKSTLLRLLLGFETPEAGTIYYDGMDLAGLDVQAVRRQIGVVLQSGKLMPGDIYENIVGSSLLTLDDAWEAAEKAGLADDVNDMPMGMHTVLGEGATTLSGGQRQRLMIARAIVAKPRILIFDEATSALDNRTQAIVSRSLEELQATRIVIAHRLSTIIHADRIFVIQAGRLVQSGNYEELMQQEGPFAELAKRQLA